jgi:hypothetical protein
MYEPFNEERRLGVLLVNIARSRLPVARLFVAVHLRIYNLT